MSNGGLLAMFWPLWRPKEDPSHLLLSERSVVHAHSVISSGMLKRYDSSKQDNGGSLTLILRGRQG